MTAVESYTFLFFIPVLDTLLMKFQHLTKRKNVLLPFNIVESTTIDVLIKVFEQNVEVDFDCHMISLLCIFF